MGTDGLCVSPVIDREAWLAGRRKGIGASEAPVVLGLAGSRLALYLDKRGLLPLDGRPRTREMELGLKWEPFIAQRWGELTGDPIVATQVSAVSPEMPWVAATIDGVAESGEIVEFKVVGPHGKVHRVEGPDDHDAIPETWMVQGCHQCLATGKDRVWFAPLLPDHDVHPIGPWYPPAGMLDAVRDAVRDFWYGHVLAGVPPEDMKPEDAEVLTRAFPRQLGDWLLLGREAAEAAIRHETLGEEIRRLRDERDVCRGLLLLALEESAGADLPGGWTIERRVVEVKEYTVEASTRIRLTIKGPKL